MRGRATVPPGNGDHEESRVSSGDFRPMNKRKLYDAGIAVSAFGMVVMTGQAAVPWFFHIAIVLFVWGGVLIGMALRGQ